MNSLDPAALQAALENVRLAGMPGIFAEVRGGGEVWRGAAGVADTDTGRPVSAEMRHRVGSITKTFTAAAVLQQVERGELGELGLDAPIGRFLPKLVPGPAGDEITVRMLLDHSSGLAEYLSHVYTSLAPFPALADTGPESMDEHRHTRFDRIGLIEAGMAAPPFGAPGCSPGLYSNTNYLLLCQLLERVSGMTAEECITRNVIEHAGLKDTGFPDGPEVEGPHSKLYESWFGMIDPPRDYSVFDMSWTGPCASLISTVADLNRYYGLLFAGEIVKESTLAEMRRTGPVVSQEMKVIEYGLGLYPVEFPGREGVCWGHGGSVWGGGALSMTRADGRRQMSVGFNMQRWNKLDGAGKPQAHPIDGALAAFYDAALFGGAE